MNLPNKLSMITRREYIKIDDTGNIQSSGAEKARMKLE